MRSLPNTPVSEWLLAPRVLFLMRLVALLAAALLVLLFINTAVHRLAYPFDLELVEGGNLIEITRVAHGLPLYVRPTTEFTSYIYPPLYYVAGALMAKLTGLSFAAPRTVSFLSTLGVFAGIFLFVLFELPRQRFRILAGVLAVGFFASTYPYTGAFFDEARVDMLSLFFAVFALLAGRRSQPVVAALLWVLAFETKQGLLPVAILALCFEWARPRRLVLGLGTFALVAGASVVWLNRLSDGWYGLYAFGTAGGFGFIPRKFAFFFTGDLIVPFGTGILLALAGLLLAPPSEPPVSWRSPAASFYAFTGFAIIGSIGFIRAHEGPAPNSIIPVFMWLAIVAGIGFGRTYALLADSDTSASAPARAGCVLLLAAAIFQIANGVYMPGAFIPGPVERAARESFIQQLRTLPGETLVFEHPTYSLMAGHPASAESLAVDAIFSATKFPGSAAFLQQYFDLIHSRHFAALALDTPADGGQWSLWVPPDFAQYYPVRALAAGGEVHGTHQPTFLYFPCASATSPDPRTLLPPGTLIDDARCH